MEANHEAHGISVNAVVLKERLVDFKPVRSFSLGDISVSIEHDGNGLYAIFEKGEYGCALRLAYTWGAKYELDVLAEDESSASYAVTTKIGRFEVAVEVENKDVPLFHVVTSISTRDDMTLSDWPRDLFILGPGRDPTSVNGIVHAAQRGLNAGLLFGSGKPEFGSFLYFQDLTTTQPYYQQVERNPEGVVGGQWPELGYAAPVNIDRPLLRAQTYTLWDTYLTFDPACFEDSGELCDQFLRLLTPIYLKLDRPQHEIYDWRVRAESTLKSLRDPRCLRRDYGQLYLRPYVEAEVPDSMVQLSAIAALRGYGAWRERPVPLADELEAGVRRFFDDKLCTLRRYLPNVGEDKDKDEVDSWYLYHPLQNLARLAAEGDEKMKQLFIESIDFGIAAAQRFNYDWPVKYNLTSLEITNGTRKPGDPGQSDVGGFYAYVMLQAHELTGDQKYLDEAEKAMQALAHRRFDLMYQANLTAYGAAAAVWLYRLTGRRQYLDQVPVFVATIVHNSIIWKSALNHADKYETFMGVTCLHDAPYMAAYECFEVYAGLREMLERGGDDLTPETRLLASELVRYAIVGAPFFFPDELPDDAIATEFRNGQVIRELSLPVEDLYADGQPAGAVGQEVYGAGAAFMYCIYANQKLPKGRGWLSSDLPIFGLEDEEDSISFTVAGDPRLEGWIKILPGKNPAATSEIEDGEEVGKHLFRVKAGKRYTLTLGD